MKKILIAFLCSLISTFSFANGKLTGTTSDYINSAKLKGVEINLAEYKSDKDGFYEISNFTPTDGLELEFKKEGYETLKGKIVGDGQGFTVYKNSKEYRSYSISQEDICTSEDECSNFKLDVSMTPNTVEVISGVVKNEKGEGFPDVIIFSQEGTNNLENYSIKTGKNGEFSIKGHFGTSENPRNYRLKFSHNSYKSEYVNIEVKESIVTQKENDDLNFNLTKKTREALTQENLESMSGFGCSDIMPKYLVGSRCVENKELKGDASDIAMWIQKFGSKITSLISMLAVILIVWNSFTLATAAGDTEKISQGKKGILWTVLGLALTMFAYIIVKTVIALTYTS